MLAWSNLPKVAIGISPREVSEHFFFVLVNIHDNVTDNNLHQSLSRAATLYNVQLGKMCVKGVA